MNLIEFNILLMILITVSLTDCNGVKLNERAEAQVKKIVVENCGIKK